MPIQLHDLPERYRLEAQRQLGGAQIPAEPSKPRKSQRTARHEPSSQDSPDLPASGPKPKRHIQAGALGATRDEAGDSGFYVVSVESFRVRLLDTDNLVPKWHVDALRYAGLLPSDAPDKCRIVTSQTKVASRAEEKTVITLERLPSTP